MLIFTLVQGPVPVTIDYVISGCMLIFTLVQGPVPVTIDYVISHLYRALYQ